MDRFTGFDLLIAYSLLTLILILKFMPPIAVVDQILYKHNKMFSIDLLVPV